ncbi:hypothetical protein ACI4BE_27795, partial [Klebsiella pneumoniae]|uniref:hypothetical protein n=1 Tax=Klebsiella pneumoniae TaxID=573 RepID=UPI0038540339
MRQLFFNSTACALALAAGAAQAQTTTASTSAAAATSAVTSSEIIVTGTRQTGLKAVDSAAPIQVLDSSALKRVGQPDLIQALAQNVPSFT